MDYAGVLRDLGELFDRLQRPYAVVGGLGLQAHGVSRATFDLDLVTHADVQAEVIEALESRGYETLHRSSGFSNHTHSSQEGGRIDLIYVSGETAEKLFSAAVRREIAPSVTALVPTAEHLIAMKVHAIKNDPARALQDLADIGSLLRVADIDPETVRGYFERADLEDLFDELRKRL